MTRHCPTAILSCALLLAGAPALGAAEAGVKRKPRNALEDIDRIGNRNVTGIFNVFTRKQDVQLGLMLAQKIEKQARLVDDPVIVEYVNRIGQNLARNSDIAAPGYLKIQKIVEETINAMALPGGYFYVNTGLIQFARDEAELAGVMAHEIAHIAGRHGTRSMSRAQVMSSVSEALLATAARRNGRGLWIAVGAASIAMPMTLLKFSRSFEKKADFLGVQYLYKSGYDPLAMVSFFERAAAGERRKKGVMAAAFSSHPLTAKRVALVRKAIDELLPARSSYALSSSEFDAVKKRVIRLYGNGKPASENTERPQIIRR